MGGEERRSEIVKMVRTKIKNDMNSGRRKGWSKLVTSVDPSKNNGYAFEGEFLDDGKEYDLPVGSVVIQKHPEGSVKHAWESGHCYTLDGDGDLCYTSDESGKESFDWHKEFLSFRDHVIAVLARSQRPAEPVEDCRQHVVDYARQFLGSVGVKTAEL